MGYYNDYVSDGIKMGADAYSTYLDYTTDTGVDSATGVPQGEPYVPIVGSAGPDFYNAWAAGNGQTYNLLFGLGGDDAAVGGDAGNWIEGGAGSDTAIGGAGSDFIFGGNVLGEVGADPSGNALAGWYGDDILVGDAGDDTLVGDDGDDYLGGNDSLFGGAGSDNLVGGVGHDLLNGEAGADTLAGGYGDDLYVVDDAADVVQELAGQGFDAVVATRSTTLPAETEMLVLAAGGGLAGTGNALANLLLGYTDANRLDGAGGDDVLFGDSGNDTLIGGAGNDIAAYAGVRDAFSARRIDADTVEVAGPEGSDRLSGVEQVAFDVLTFGVTVLSLAELLGEETVPAGSAGPDTLTGADGRADTLAGLAGNDRLDGRGGADTLLGGDGKDTLIGGAGNDRLDGGSGNDNLKGDGGKDTLIGGTGNDRLDGGAGNDNLKGGTGLDLFRFGSALGSGNRDTVGDFNAADDTIELENALFAKLTATGTLGAAYFRASGTGLAADGNDYILYNTTTGVLCYDADGSGAGAALQFATLTGVPTLTCADFVVS